MNINLSSGCNYLFYSQITYPFVKTSYLTCYLHYYIYNKYKNLFKFKVPCSGNKFKKNFSLIFYV